MLEYGNVGETDQLSFVIKTDAAGVERGLQRASSTLA